jgi:hypothetical protein
MRTMKKAYKILVGKTEGKGYLGVSSGMILK